MKKILIPFISLVFLLSFHNVFSQANSITIGLQGNACDELVIEWTSSFSFVGSGNNQWSQATITITYPNTASTDAFTLGTITSLLPGFTGWQYGDGTSGAVNVGGIWQREVILLSGGYTQDIPIGTTEIITIQLNGTGSSNFTVADPNTNTDISSASFGIGVWDGTFSPATVTGQSLDDVIAWDGTDWCGGSGSNNQPGSGDGAIDCNITGPGGQLTQWGAQVNALTIQSGADLSIMPSASLTANGTTTINQPQGLIIECDATGASGSLGSNGSFIDNGTITYGSGGSAVVKTFIANSASPGSLHYHHIGPAVHDPAFATTYSGERGVFLNAFDLAALSTYAYRYDEPTNGWLNIFSNTDPVPMMAGIMLSDNTGTNSTLSMVGELNTGTTLTTLNPALSPYNVSITGGGGNGLYAASNPFPSGFDIQAWWSAFGSSNVGTSIYVWDNVANNYSTMTYVVVPFPQWSYSGSTALSLSGGVVNPAQGFFTQVVNAAITQLSFGFAPSHRVHYHGPFIKERDITPNSLRLKMMNEYSHDVSVIFFAEGASNGYEDEADAYKWMSMSEEASEIYTVASGDSKLSLNGLPPLGAEMVTVPLHFLCGVQGQHSIEASDFESFEPGTEIYLEDLVNGDPWYNLIENPVYEFTGNPDDPDHRFNIHFFGPTGIEEPGAAEEAIRIYSHKEYAYIMNDGSEEIEEFIVYDMTGQEVIRGTLPSSSLNKIYIGERTAYYVVQVITRNRSYNGKVLITK